MWYPKKMRFLAALFTLFTVLFAQLAVAGYVCPGDMPANHSTVAQASVESIKLMPADCAGTDMEQPSLCHAHNLAGNQSLDKPDLPQVQPFVAGSLILALSFIEAPALTWQTQWRPSATGIARGQSLLIRHCSFQI